MLLTTRFEHAWQFIRIVIEVAHVVPEIASRGDPLIFLISSKSLLSSPHTLKMPFQLCEALKTKAKRRPIHIE